MAMIGESEQDDDLHTIADMEHEADEEDEEFDGIDYSDKNYLIQLLMNQHLSAGIPITSRAFDKYKTKHYEVSSVGLQGYRDNMEDQHLIHFNLRNIANCSVFGVFDGHGGDLTSKFVKNTLIEILEDAQWANENEFDDKSLIECVKQLDLKWIEFENKRKQLKEEQIRKEQQQMEQKVIQFTMDSDDSNNNHENDDDTEQLDLEDGALYSNVMDDPMHLGVTAMATNEFGSVGSTVVFCIVQYDETQDTYHIITVNLGDSRAIVLRNKDDEKAFELVELTQDHKPDDEEERARIINAGGHVKFNRVDGDLALSRAIGDTKYKQNASLDMEEQKISCVASITRSTCKSGDYLLVFCDGIVEYKDNEDVFSFMINALSDLTNDDERNNDNTMRICSHLSESELNYLTSNPSLGLIPRHEIELRGLEKVLLNLTNWALETGSKDNMTAMCVKLGKTNNCSTVYQRLWSPCDFYQHKVQFNNIGEEIKDKDKLTLDRFMRLFEADCSNTGWDLSTEYENALLQKILYLNDLITNHQQKEEIKQLIQTQNNKLQRLQANITGDQEEKKKKKKKGVKRKQMDDADDETYPMKKRRR
eukprot:195803_1